MLFHGDGKKIKIKKKLKNRRFCAFEFNYWQEFLNYYAFNNILIANWFVLISGEF